jgi:hypothetical protein
MRQALPDAGKPLGPKKEAFGIVLFAFIAAIGVTLLHLCLLGP